MEPPLRPGRGRPELQEIGFAEDGTSFTPTSDSSALTSPTTSIPPLTRRSPLDSTTQHATVHEKKNTDSLSPYSTVGTFSYAPATQTKVVTTTTTTTVSFPPMMIKQPRHLNDLDPREYPLSSAPTPESLKRVAFNYEGVPVNFIEAQDPMQGLNEVRIISIARSSWLGVRVSHVSC
jgi:hypothetical protein